MAEQFEEEWRRTFREERKKILLWERLFLPTVPVELTEESVLAYLKTVRPSIRRGRVLPLWMLNEILKMVPKIIGWTGFALVSLIGGSAWCIQALIDRENQWHQLDYLLMVWGLGVVVVSQWLRFGGVAWQWFAWPFALLLLVFRSFVSKIPSHIHDSCRSVKERIMQTMSTL